MRCVLYGHHTFGCFPHPLILCALDPCNATSYFQMIFKSPTVNNLLFQGFHLHCLEPPHDLTSSSQLEGIEDILPSDVDMIKRWIVEGAAKSGKVRNRCPKKPGGDGWMCVCRPIQQLLTMHIQRRILRQTYDTVENYYPSNIYCMRPMLTCT